MTVDARLDLAVEERQRAVLLRPAKPGGEPVHRIARARGIDLGPAQHHGVEQRRQPVGLAGDTPHAVRILPLQQVRADALARDASALRGERRIVGIAEIAERLVPNRGVAVEQPGDDVHARIIVGRARDRRSCDERGRAGRCGDMRAHASVVRARLRSGPRVRQL
jgi:hypothetical protein